MKRIIVLKFEKSTKNTHKYAEVPDAGQPPVIDHLYIKKWALPTANALVRVTIETPEVTI